MVSGVALRPLVAPVVSSGRVSLKVALCVCKEIHAISESPARCSGIPGATVLDDFLIGARPSTASAGHWSSRWECAAFCAVFGVSFPTTLFRSYGQETALFVANLVW